MSVFSEENIIFMLNKCKMYIDRMDIEWNISIERIILGMMDEAYRTCPGKSVADINIYAFHTFTLHF